MYFASHFIRNNSLINCSSANAAIFLVYKIPVYFELCFGFTVLRTLKFEIGIQLTIKMVVLPDRRSTSELVEWLFVIVVITAHYSLHYYLLKGKVNENVVFQTVTDTVRLLLVELDRVKTRKYVGYIQTVLSIERLQLILTVVTVNARVIHSQRYQLIVELYFYRL